MNSGTTFNPATMISVKAEGALGNGSSDDTGAVQKAELDAKAQGKTVFFDQGIYGLSPAIQI
jgi:polygalacturonase